MSIAGRSVAGSVTRGGAQQVAAVSRHRSTQGTGARGRVLAAAHITDLTAILPAAPSAAPSPTQVCSAISASHNEWSPCETSDAAFSTPLEQHRPPLFHLLRMHAGCIFGGPDHGRSRRKSGANQLCESGARRAVVIPGRGGHASVRHDAASQPCRATHAAAYPCYSPCCTRRVFCSCPCPQGRSGHFNAGAVAWEAGSTPAWPRLPDDPPSESSPLEPLHPVPSRCAHQQVTHTASTCICFS